MTDDDRDPRLLTGAYALDAVSPSEAEAIERAADSSESLREELDGLTGTATLLGLAATPVMPSARLKADLMAKIALTPQLTNDPPASSSTPISAVEASASAAPAAPAPVADASAASAAPSVALSTESDAVAGPRETAAQRRWFTRPVGILTAAAAAAALFLGGGFVGSALVNSGSSTTVIDAAASQLAQLTAADDAQRTTVAVQGGGNATVLWSNELGRSAVLADGLPSLPDGKVYEAWYIDSDGAAPAGTFTAAGTGTSWHVLDGALTPGDAVGVTVEPAGGSQAPTTDPILVVQSA
ncbi:anti-sigma factor [Herbiconiux solani]|uniref:anti-sigma factor n=1 Tax=Herbiconiux solani TaxID=661329 RepID=UPI0008240CA3|nr:anti-sigma factor [Herbiconiux solani]